MGLGNVTDTSSEETSGNKSTYITFKNPRQAEINDQSEHRHQQEYYDAAKEMRQMIGQNINVVVGEFLAAAVAAENGNPEPLSDLFSDLTEE